MPREPVISPRSIILPLFQPNHSLSQPVTLLFAALLLPQILERLDEVGAGFRSTTEAIDTTTPAGRMMLQMLGAFAEFERQMIRERTKLGIARARLEGKQIGNRHSLTPKQQATALQMIDEGKSQSEIAEVFRVHRSTICRLAGERRVLEYR